MTNKKIIKKLTFISLVGCLVLSMILVQSFGNQSTAKGKELTPRSSGNYTPYIGWGGFTEIDFNVPSFDGKEDLPTTLLTANPSTKQPVVILVHGLGCSKETWLLKEFSYLLATLLARGFTLVLYTVPEVSVKWIPDFTALPNNLYSVIKHISTDSGLLPYIDENKIGLVGHSLGAWTVTIAACQSTGYLREYYSKVKIAIEVDGPSNLRSALDYLIATGSSLAIWAQLEYAAACAAPSPIGYGKSEAWAVDLASGIDPCDTIYMAFCVFHHALDTTIPYATNGAPLYNDARNNGIHWLQYHQIWIWSWWTWEYTVVTANYNVYQYTSTFTGADGHIAVLIDPTAVYYLGCYLSLYL